MPSDYIDLAQRSQEPASIISRDDALALFERMTLIRAVEDSIQRLYNESHVRGTTHIYSGEEAIATGVCSVLLPDDRVAATYRGHGHAIALGTNPQGLLDELLGRATGICAGRAGSMNVVDIEHGLIGCFGIVGGSIAAATGAALALKGTGAIAVAFFGDGAVNQAYFYECLNFAQVNQLPVLLVCENNLYGEFTPGEDSTAGTICDRAKIMGIPASRIDGNDLWTVRATATDATAQIRRESRPVFIEAMTYRFGGHSRSDPGRYRPPGELEAWRERDPLLIARQTLTAAYQMGDEDLDAIQTRVDERVKDMIAAGLAAPPAADSGSLGQYHP